MHLSTLRPTLSMRSLTPPSRYSSLPSWRTWSPPESECPSAARKHGGGQPLVGAAVEGRAATHCRPAAKQPGSRGRPHADHADQDFFVACRRPPTPLSAADHPPAHCCVPQFLLRSGSAALHPVLDRHRGAVPGLGRQVHDRRQEAGQGALHHKLRGHQVQGQRLGREGVWGLIILGGLMGVERYEGVIRSCHGQRRPRARISQLSGARGWVGDAVATPEPPVSQASLLLRPWPAAGQDVPVRRACSGSSAGTLASIVPLSLLSLSLSLCRW